MITTSEVDDMWFASKSMRKGGLSTTKRTGVRGRQGAVKAVTKATHLSRTKATTARIPKVTRTRRAANRQEDSVSITCTASRK